MGDGEGLLIQVLSARLGVATGRHSSASSDSSADSILNLCLEEYLRWASFSLWVMTELALIGADIHEIIGCTIAIKILSGGVVPLWAGIIITALDSYAIK